MCDGLASDRVANSAEEQSLGLSEVNAAVNQMDQTTQQNAAMAEEASASSTSLANEADKLRRLVAQFETGGTLSRQTATAQPEAVRYDHRATQ